MVVVVRVVVDDNGGSDGGHCNNGDGGIGGDGDGCFDDGADSVVGEMTVGEHRWNGRAL